VLRDEGQESEIAALGVVPGDVVVLRAGMRVPADLYILSASSLEIDEAPLTGESIPNKKIPAPTNTRTHTRTHPPDDAMSVVVIEEGKEERGVVISEHKAYAGVCVCVCMCVFIS
jgi:P-type E1-E2 ATPase